MENGRALAARQVPGSAAAARPAVRGYKFGSRGRSMVQGTCNLRNQLESALLQAHVDGLVGIGRDVARLRLVADV